MLRSRLRVGSPSTGDPANSTLPSVGTSKPVIIRMSVVLPQPDGPRIEKNSLLPISRSIGCTTVLSPNVFVMPVRRTAGTLPVWVVCAVGGVISGTPFRDRLGGLHPGPAVLVEAHGLSRVDDELRVLKLLFRSEDRRVVQQLLIGDELCGCRVCGGHKVIVGGCSGNFRAEDEVEPLVGGVSVRGIRGDRKAVRPERTAFFGKHVLDVGVVGDRLGDARASPRFSHAGITRGDELVVVGRVVASEQCLLVN